MVRGEGLQARIFSHRFESVSVQRWLAGHLWIFFIPSGRILGNKSKSWINSKRGVHKRVHKRTRGVHKKVPKSKGHGLDRHKLQRPCFVFKRNPNRLHPFQNLLHQTDQYRNGLFHGSQDLFMADFQCNFSAA